MQRFSSTSPSRADPPMTYDEASMQSSRHFYMSLQELKNLRPQLYSAAEYCESSYIFNDQKQVVLENLKDYSIKAIVNAVDHLGTVAYKLNEVLSQETSDISSAEIRVAALAQRIRLCQEHTMFENLDKQRLNKSNRRYHRHYVLPDAVPNFKDDQEDTSENKKKSSHEPEYGEPHPVRNTSRTLSWHLAADPFTATKRSSGLRQDTKRLQPSAGVSESPMPGYKVPDHPTERVGSSAILLPTPRGLDQVSSRDSSNPSASHPSLGDRHISPHGSPLPTRSKSLLSSLLGKGRNEKLSGHTHY